jgi:peptidyl-prolyl cis-trans isomerase A (cyclophilin A)
MKQLLVIAAILLAPLCQARMADETPPAASAASAAQASGAAAAKSADTPAPAPKPVAKSATTQLLVVTNMGNFTIELNAERAPLTVAHVLKYVDAGHYTNTIFHRVIPNFVVQGGGFDVNYKAVPTGTHVANESGNGLSNGRGTVGMARSNDPHGADAQFYVNISDNPTLDPNASRWGYAVFGKVVSGMEVIDRISNVPTGSHGAIKEDTPVKPVIIERVERVTAP